MCPDNYVLTHFMILFSLSLLLLSFAVTNLSITENFFNAATHSSWISFQFFVLKKALVIWIQTCLKCLCVMLLEKSWQKQKNFHHSLDLEWTVVLLSDHFSYNSSLIPGVCFYIHNSAFHKWHTYWNTVPSTVMSAPSLALFTCASFVLFQYICLFLYLGFNCILDFLNDIYTLLYGHHRMGITSFPLFTPPVMFSFYIPYLI